MLFRYSAITDNPHRIHYDQPYATGRLLEMFRTLARREPWTLVSRNIAPMYCGQPLRLCIKTANAGAKLWAENAMGVTAFEATVQ